MIKIFAALYLPHGEIERLVVDRATPEPWSSRRNDLPVLSIAFDLAAQLGSVLVEDSERLN